MLLQNKKGVTWDLNPPLFSTNTIHSLSMWRRLLSSHLKTLATTTTTAAAATSTRCASLHTRSIISPSASLSCLRHFSVDSGTTHLGSFTLSISISLFVWLMWFLFRFCSWRCRQEESWRCNAHCHWPRAWGAWSRSSGLFFIVFNLLFGC